VIQDRTRLAQVAADHADRPGVVQERAAVQFHHGIVVDVHHARAGDDLLDDFVGVAHGRQPGSDVDELPHALLRNELGRPLVEAPVGEGRVPDLRGGLEYLLGGEAVGLEVVMTLEHVVVDPGGAGPARVDASWNMRSLVHNRLPGEQSVLSLARFVRITNPDT
jgi:hypothetical protein